MIFIYIIEFLNLAHFCFLKFIFRSYLISYYLTIKTINKHIKNLYFENHPEKCFTQKFKNTFILNYLHLRNKNVD